jgi:hypothetical protein
MLDDLRSVQKIALWVGAIGLAIYASVGGFIIFSMFMVF